MEQGRLPVQDAGAGRAEAARRLLAIAPRCRRRPGRRVGRAGAGGSATERRTAHAPPRPRGSRRAAGGSACATGPRRGGWCGPGRVRGARQGLHACRRLRRRARYTARGQKARFGVGRKPPPRRGGLGACAPARGRPPPSPVPRTPARRSRHVSRGPRPAPAPAPAGRRNLPPSTATTVSLCADASRMLDGRRVLALFRRIAIRREALDGAAAAPCTPAVASPPGSLRTGRPDAPPAHVPRQVSKILARPLHAVRRQPAQPHPPSASQMPGRCFVACGEGRQPLPASALVRRRRGGNGRRCAQRRRPATASLFQPRRASLRPRASCGRLDAAAGIRHASDPCL